MEILIKNLQNKIRFDRKYLEKVVTKTIRNASVRVSPIEISLVMVDNKQIRSVNRKYRKINRATDVIAFPADQEIPGKAASSRFEGKKVYGGDIFISAEKARSQAKSLKHSFKKEISLLTVHGVLHLFGYDHMKKKDAIVMKGKEGKVLSCLSL